MPSASPAPSTSPPAAWRCATPGRPPGGARCRSRAGSRPYRAEIDASDDPAAKLAEIEARLQALRSPFRTAEAFWVEEIIDPRDTRRVLCEFARLAWPLLTPGPSAFGMRP